METLLQIHPQRRWRPDARPDQQGVENTRKKAEIEPNEPSTEVVKPLEPNKSLSTTEFSAGGLQSTSSRCESGA